MVLELLERSLRYRWTAQILTAFGDGELKIFATQSDPEEAMFRYAGD